MICKGKVMVTLTSRMAKTINVAIVVTCLALFCFAGDAAAGKANKNKKRGQEETEMLQLMWPEPPQTPRIKFKDIYSSEEHVGRKPTRKELFMRFIGGVVPPRSHVYQPMDIVVSDDGNRFYVADFGQNLVFEFDLEAKRTRVIGDMHPLASPFGLALDDEENLYISEQAKRRVIVIDRDRAPIRVIEHDSLVRPGDIAIDRERHLLYVADPSTKASEDHSVKVFDLEGNLLRTVGSKGVCDGCLFFPTFVEVDLDGNVYVTSTLKSRVDVFNAEGNYVKHFGDRGTNFGMFDKPKGVAIDSFGNVYVVDSGWSNVQIFNQKGEVLLYFGARGIYPGLLKNPTGIAIDRQNRIYVADFLNYRVSTYELVNTTAEDSYLDPSQQGDTASVGGE